MYKWILLLTMVSTVQAGTLDDVELLYGWKSHHWVTEDYTQDTHHMVGIKKDNYVVGTFENSYQKQTTFAGYYTSTYLGDIELFGVFGGMHGYTKCYGDDNSSKNLCPLAVFGITYTGIHKSFKPTLYQLGDASVIGFRVGF